MAEAQVARSVRDSDNDSNNDLTDSVSVCESDSLRKRGGSPKKKEKKRKSKYDTLEEKWQTKFDKLDSKMERMFTLLESAAQSRTQSTDRLAHSRADQDTAESCRLTQSRANLEQARGHDIEHTTTSGHLSSPDFRSRRQIQSDEESEFSLHANMGNNNFSDGESDVECVVSEKTKKNLFELFGEDAITKKTEKKQGIELDISQKQVLQGHWRTDKPQNVTAFAEENQDLFNISEESEEWLKVPTLDDIAQSCLVKKYGPKASTLKNGTGLFSQPCKMAEKTAYRGQQAAFMGIKMNVYLQQNLSALLNTLEKDRDVDAAITQVRDIFAISTKTLDQFGRTGAFHHIVRRQLTMSDTSLYELDDSKSIAGLPLTGEGVLGSSLENTLKEKKEKKKTLEDLMPKFSKQDSYKRKSFHSKENTYPIPKRQCLEQRNVTSSQNLSNFRIPRTKTASEYFRQEGHQASGQGDKPRPQYGQRKQFPASRGGKSGGK